MALSPEVIAKGTGATIENATKFAPYLNRYMNKYGINNAERAMMFLAQIGAESARLKATEEYASGAAYEGRSDLGNTQQGDGVRFKGRGLIQITGRANYQKVKDSLGWDVVNNPQLLEQPDKATEVSAWWYSQRKRDGKTLNEWADLMKPNQSVNEGNNAYVFEQITRAINGGVNGLESRKEKYENAQSFYREFKRALSSWLGKWWAIPVVVITIGTSLYFIVKQIKKNKNEK